jgi:hypothetical protein
LCEAAPRTADRLTLEPIAVKCLYYLAPTLDSTQQIAASLHALGLRDALLHVVSRDEAGLKSRDIHSSNYLETLNLIPDGCLGGAIGLLAGLAGVGLLRYAAPFGPAVPGFVYLALAAAATLFGAWEGGLKGIATENRKLAAFHDDLEAGRYLLLIYVPKSQEASVTEMMRARHREAQLAAIDEHFINPFSAVKRRSAPPCPQGGL